MQIDFAPIPFWLACSAVLFMLELFFVTGIGFLFLALGSLSTAIILNYTNLIGMQQYALQSAVFLSISVVWWAILWNPIRKLIACTYDEPNLTMINQQVKVFEQDLPKNEVGTVKWSGTVLRAQLAENVEANFVAKQDSYLYIQDIKGNLLIVSPEKLNNK